MKLTIISTVLTLFSIGFTDMARPVQTDEQPSLVRTVRVPEELKVKLQKPADIAAAPKLAPSVANPGHAGDNENIIWSFLISQGFTRNQTAGIMGNLQQEHGFKTSDERPNGLGIAQWVDSRADRLVAKGNYLDINVQLNYLMEELNGVEAPAHAAIRSSGSVEEATRAFQNKFERCGDCRESTRIGYSYSILARH